jgi:hypothetical protein
MRKMKYLAFLLLMMLCYSLFLYNARAQSSSQIIMSSQGNINYTTSPTPTPTPTPAPTPTPPPSGNNLAPFPSAWETTNTGMTWAIGGTSNVVLDSSVTYNGVASIRIDPVGSSQNYALECDGPWINIAPGNHIVFSCWLKTSGMSLARIGIDFFGSGYGITGTASYSGAVWSPSGGWPGDQIYISPNTDWTLVTIDFVVPATYPSGNGITQTNPWALGTPIQPGGMIPWLQNVNGVEGYPLGGSVWFANPTLYIT